MGLSDINRTDLVQLYQEKSDLTFKEAESAIESKSWPMAANRLYYSMFHIVCALFVKDECPIKSHRGAKAVLSRNYVLTGKLDSIYSTVFAQLETLRDKADYDVTFTATEKEILTFQPLVSSFIQKIKDLINVA